MKKPCEIIEVPNKILHEVAQPVTSFDNELNKKIKRMIEVLKADENGIGLSANQLGLNNRLCVIEFNDPEKKGKQHPFTNLYQSGDC